MKPEEVFVDCCVVAVVHNDVFLGGWPGAGQLKHVEREVDVT